MPTIGGGSSLGGGKTYAVGFWDSENCDNSLAEFPSGENFSWGVLSFFIDGCDKDNYVEMKVLSPTKSILFSRKYTTNGRKELDLSQYSNIGSTQDISVRVEITTFV